MSGSTRSAPPTAWHCMDGSPDDTSLTAMAERVLNLALLAPQRNGIAPTIFYVDSSGGHWVADHAWGGISHGECYPMFHNAWTSTWLLRWGDLLPSRRKEIVRFAKSFGEFLLKHQRANGVIPSWYDPETLTPAAPLKEENAETAGAALFLAELFERTGERRYLDACGARDEIRASRRLSPRRKWYDFETFFSCSRKPVGFFDTYTQQPPQNTLSMQLAAEACNALCRMRRAAKSTEGRRGDPRLSLSLPAGLESTLALARAFRRVRCPEHRRRMERRTAGIFRRDIDGLLRSYRERPSTSSGASPRSGRCSPCLSLPSLRARRRTMPIRAWTRPAGVTGLHWGTGQLGNIHSYSPATVRRCPRGPPEALGSGHRRLHDKRGRCGRIRHYPDLGR